MVLWQNAGTNWNDVSRKTIFSYWWTDPHSVIPNPSLLQHLEHYVEVPLLQHTEYHEPLLKKIFRLVSLPCSSSTHREWNTLHVLKFEKCGEWNESISCWTTKSCWQYASHMGKWETCLLILHSSAPSVCCCSCSNLKCYSTRKSVYSVLWTTGYLEIVEYQACAENVWVYTHKVWLLGVHHHLDSLTMQGKIPFLRKTNSSTINCNNTMSVPCKISAQCDYLSP